VLDGLIYLICELYIDDVLIDGVDEDTFVNNVRQVFARFRKHKIIVNPKKTELGLEEVEYVGPLVSHKGQKIINFERPRTHKEMLMYVGLVNYFHDHVRNMNDLLRPLRKMVERYDKHKFLEWTQELITIYEESRRIIADCQQLFFMDENAQITLQTDASDFGIGGYLFQTVDNMVQVIMCISKALVGAHFRWS